MTLTRWALGFTAIALAFSLIVGAAGDLAVRRGSMALVAIGWVGMRRGK